MHKTKLSSMFLSLCFLYTLLNLNPLPIPLTYKASKEILLSTNDVGLQSVVLLLEKQTSVAKGDCQGSFRLAI